MPIVSVTVIDILKSQEHSRAMEDSSSALSALLPECAELAELYLMMQKQCSHRLSKISLFVSKIADIRALCDSGCKWLNKESTTRQKEIETADTADWQDIIDHNSKLEGIEGRVSCVLQKRMAWLRMFATQVGNCYATLEKVYDDISILAVNELEGDEVKVSPRQLVR